MDNYKGSKLVLALTDIKSEFESELEEVCADIFYLASTADRGEKSTLLKKLGELVEAIGDLHSYDTAEEDYKL